LTSKEDVMKAEQNLDCMGLYCPMPIVKTAEKIKAMSIGEVLEIVADDIGIKPDMTAWSKATGHELLKIEDGDSGEIKVYVKKTHD